MSKQNITKICILSAIAIALIALIYVKNFGIGSTPASEKTIAFAKCLADKKITMYGSRLCPHCTNQKEMFGSAFKYVPYVECLDEPDKCAAANITGYPTWIMPDLNNTSGTPKILLGEKSFEELAMESGCQY